MSFDKMCEFLVNIINNAKVDPEWEREWIYVTFETKSELGDHLDKIRLKVKEGLNVDEDWFVIEEIVKKAIVETNFERRFHSVSSCSKDSEHTTILIRFIH
jgi:hypothetical protein